MKVFVFLVLLILSGCAHFFAASDGSGYTDSDALLKDPRLQGLSINIRCSIYDLDGKFRRKFRGLFCRFLDDGSHIMAGGIELTKYDKNLNQVWKFGIEMSHHHLELSPYTSNLLALDSFTYFVKGREFRGDILLIVSPEGKLIKRVNFNDILTQAENQGYNLKPAAEATWISKGTVPHHSVSEVSHVNSFYEIWNPDTGTVSGYIVNCYHQQKIFILDAKAEKLVNVIDMSGRKIHDVQMYKNKLYFYVNSDANLEKNRLSYIGSYELNSKKYEIVYQSAEPAFSGNACSSVQVVDADLFAVLHSNCAPTPETTAVPRFEIIDVKQKLRYRTKFERPFPATNAYLFKSESFLKNNSGF